VQRATLTSCSRSARRCPQDFRTELTVPECAAAVAKGVERAAENIRFDERLADACFQDREQFCGDLVPGSARVIRCLQARLRRVGFDLVWFGSNIVFVVFVLVVNPGSVAKRRLSPSACQVGQEQALAARAGNFGLPTRDALLDHREDHREQHFVAAYLTSV
jgi:Cysteine rich repeat